MKRDKNRGALQATLCCLPLIQPLSLFLLLAVLLFPSPALSENAQNKPADEQKNWYVGLYAGQSNDRKLLTFVTMHAHYEPSYIFGVTLGRRIVNIGEHFRLDGEAQFAQHEGMQHHQEVAGTVILRVQKFPWDKYLKTSFAVGEGLSYATSIPNIEEDDWKPAQARLLNLLLFEAAAVVSETPKLKVEPFVRIHHRSGIFGLVSGVHNGGSNFLTGGIRLYF